MLGIALGGLSGHNYANYIFLTTVGLICFLTSVVTKSKKVFFYTRIAGLLLVATLIYSDIRNSNTLEKSWENIKDIFTYLPVVTFCIYTFYSIIRLSIIAGQKSD